MPMTDQKTLKMIHWPAFRAHMADVAIRAAEAHQGGRILMKLGHARPQMFDFDLGGYCARFVRQIVEVIGAEWLPDDCDLFDWDLSTGRPFPWKFARANARLMCDALGDAGLLVGKSLSVAQPGDIIGINKPKSNPYGHIAIFVGKHDGTPTIAENTSAGNRGEPRDPGTKLTPWSAISSRVTGVYRLG